MNKNLTSLMLLSITYEDIEILESTDHKDLAKWWCKLNSWEWVDELPDEPNDSVATSEINDRRGVIMELIHDIIGERMISREWNRDRMTDLEHDIWFNKNKQLLKNIHEGNV